MSRGIDHLVVAVPDLATASARYEALGFTLTPRASHPDAMGTANRLAQFAGRNFLELLEVDRPGTLDGHDLAASPPRFSFGAHNRDFLRGRDCGLSMLVLATDDARRDLERFEAAGLRTHAPFEFERRATMPDGGEARVAFRLGFVTTPEMPDIAFFVCENRFSESFWKPPFQVHANRARAISRAYLAASRPEVHRDFLSALTGGSVETMAGGLRLACGDQDLCVLEPAALAPLAHLDPRAGPRLVGFAVDASGVEPHVTPPDEACGAFIEWRPLA